ncbi:hypothetical protein M422DRAFT_251111 [Sphaerobolus stellatus SS14]|uniref:Unplaced genomic scaffold SPHSTscaffold_37, whole genome shotgun sequence n=1 Tax=Sphaerobolus stellatus (strain SS14) TaxID=990650 RepID=A0A0C9VE73_SPHS4|nr:hypothetical protein M422DRAFT_251111 [Sphaerobolus stellatus SS14]
MPSSFILECNAIAAGDMVDDTDILKQNFILRVKKLTERSSSMRVEFSSPAQEASMFRSVDPQTTAKDNAAAGLEDSLKCSLCWETLCNPVILPTWGHTFCAGCATQFPQACILCRTPRNGLQGLRDYTLDDVIQKVQMYFGF